MIPHAMEICRSEVEVEVAVAPFWQVWWTPTYRRDEALRRAYSLRRVKMRSCRLVRPAVALMARMLLMG